MKTLAGFLSVLLCVAPFGVARAVVPSTAGNNLTAYNGESGATDNNRWNTLMNSRTGMSENTTAAADFGNCNALIMRCAQPKCANGGCTDMSVTFAIVSGCVQSNASCKQYGDDLVQYISAQLVASSTAKANAAANAAQTAAAQAAAQQSAQQMAAMQAQMQQMQADMAAQNAQTVAQLQSALDEQKQLTANAIAEATAARETQVSQPTSQSGQVSTVDNGLTSAQMVAAQNGVSADVLAREQITGQIMSAIENAEVQLKTLKTTMEDAFTYAGCDTRGNNCTGPKRVKMFKQKAEGFFDPYENVLDEMYDALILAQSVGVDITDIYMMLNGSCNVWGQYLCAMGAQSNQQQICQNVTKIVDKDGNTTTTQECHYVTTTQLPTYTETSCPNGKSVRKENARGGHECVIGQIIPPEDDISCTLQKTIVDNASDPVQRDWLWAETSDSGANIRVGCASSALETSTLFRGRKKQATIDVETLQKIIAQDEPPAVRSKGGLEKEQVKYCAVTDKTYADLQKMVTMKTLPAKDVCINERKLNDTLNQVLLFDDASIIEQEKNNCMGEWSDVVYRCFCTRDAGGTDCNMEKSRTAMNEAHAKLCKNFGGTWRSGNTCNCSTASDENKTDCEYRFSGEYGASMSGISKNFTSFAGYNMNVLSLVERNKQQNEESIKSFLATPQFNVGENVKSWNGTASANEQTKADFDKVISQYK